MTEILFFGRLRDVAGGASRRGDLPGWVRTVADVCAWLSTDDPCLGAAIAAPDIRVAVDWRFCLSQSESVCGAREIAFLPPLSGG